MQFKSILFLASCCCIIKICSGQSEGPKKETYKFRSTLLTGLMEGEKGGYFQIQSLNGILHKTWFAGIGVGIDHYYIRSVPVVIQFEKKLSDKSTAMYVYGNGGLNFPWPTNNPDQTGMKRDWIIEMGAGYRVQTFRKNAIVFSAGYTLKHLRQSVAGWPVTYDPVFSYLDYTQHYSYSFAILSIKAGIEF